MNRGGGKAFPMLFDTHTHIDQPEFDVDRADVLARAVVAGVGTVMAIGTTAAASETCAHLATEFAAVYAAVGIQPNYVAEARAGDWNRIIQLAKRAKVVAIGETGLDRHWDHTPFDLQRETFQRHLELSRSAGLPVVVHMRDCEVEMLEALRQAHRRGPLQGVMHSFTGCFATAAECIEMGLYISFAGMVTFKKSDALRACAARLPGDRILIETDSPYLSPQPVRGQRRNEPANVRHTAACLADVRGQTLEAFASQATANARRLFGIG